ncbi:MAG: UDP-N-acetylmuramoyl-L-alanyl-D-glutamate--2,6-diaminopimelate ligase [Desulfovibrionaceae bacterium]|nr:UDP-N-acetylmuramoyl-L-alanyl-D-glutamate--2,6-diaminopimelate ligase [Desulfovibrionaceae bacterium]
MDAALKNLTRLAGQGVSVRDDSRTVGPGDIFVAVGEAGARHIPQAVEAGAAYVVHDAGDATFFGGQIQAVKTQDARAALGELAKARFGANRRGLKLIGLTGTNGKTTTAYLLERLFFALGRRAGVIGTVGYRWPGHDERAPLTTPGCLRLHELLAQMAEAGTEVAIMEVSSHALAQKRVAGLAFDAVALTNVTQDHLDYHGDMEAYFAAKASLFTGYPGPDKPAAINCDDPYGRRLLADLPGAMAYGLSDPPAGCVKMLRGRIVKSSIKGLALETSFGRERWTVVSPLIGAHNAANLLTAQAVGLLMGLAPSDLTELSGAAGAPGRLERIKNHRGLDVFVDYAHTPDALQSVLAALKPLTQGRLIVVFGCGGDRDRTKRPLMGAAVAAVADLAVLTSDNPRFEEPEAIIEDVIEGLGACKNLIVETDRKAAIAMALEAARPGDAVLVAGKGHEDYQEIQGVRSPFDDGAVIREILAC